MPPVPQRLRALADSFVALPAAGMATGLLGGYALVELDYGIDIDPGVFTFVDLESARTVLQTIATVTVSVAGLAFSVTVVALQLASQQLSPRVLRTFERDRLAQSVLALFVGVFVYCLVVLAKLRDAGVPALSLTVGMVGAIVAFGLFVAFIDHIVRSLKASTILSRIGADGRAALRRGWPGDVGHEPDDARGAAAAVEIMSRGVPAAVVRATGGGFVSFVDGRRILEIARDGDLFVEQRAELGAFVLTGHELAFVWSASGHADDDVVERIRGCFARSSERSIDVDVAYPVRQLVDVALRALSPSLNDPTTADNALSTMADVLVRFTAEPRPSRVRVDDVGIPRLLARVPHLDDLVFVGFEQVRPELRDQPVLRRRVLQLLGEIADSARAHGVATREVARQRHALETLLDDVRQDERARCSASG